MKANHLERLFRSAAQAAESAPTEVPFGFDTRVLAGWRSGGVTSDFVELSRFLRGAGVIACAVLVIAGAATYRQYRDETKFASLPTNEYAIADAAIEREFSQ
jgi:hypothetical protein